MMLGFFKRTIPAVDACELGRTVVALALPAGSAPPSGCQAVVVGTDGRTRRLQAARRIEAREGETAYAFHPGPYTADLLPFEAAPEICLRTSFAIDAPDPQASQQRFDLYLASEVSGRLALAALVAAIEAALRHELATGGLELPPCTTLEEWNAFRQGLNQLLYMRFGVTVDDCVPVDLGDSRDYARELAARAQAAAEVACPSVETKAVPAERFDPAAEDAKALRRLFLELPCLMCGLRLAAMPAAQEQFHRQQALLQRLDLVSVGVNAMPALALMASCAAHATAAAPVSRWTRPGPCWRACARPAKPRCRICTTRPSASSPTWRPIAPDGAASAMKERRHDPGRRFGKLRRSVPLPAGRRLQPDADCHPPPAHEPRRREMQRGR
jgi:hypothetical protein